MKEEEKIIKIEKKCNQTEKNTLYYKENKRI